MKEIIFNINEEAIRKYFQDRYVASYSKELKRDTTIFSIGALVFLVGIVLNIFTSYTTETDIIITIGLVVFGASFIKYLNYKSAIYKHKRSVTKWIGQLKTYKEVKIIVDEKNLKHITSSEKGIETNIYNSNDFLHINKYSEGIYIETRDKKNMLIPKKCVSEEGYSAIESFLASV
jgi:hypothetical protein